MKVKKQIVLLFSVLVLVPVTLLITNSSSEKHTLFIITRNFDNDILNYDLRLDTEGKLVDDDPIHPYWIRNTEGGVIKELNGMQRKFAYGLEYSKLSEELYKFNFVSYDKMDLYLKRSSGDKYHVLAKIDEKYVIVKEIFLQVEKNGTIFNLPKLNWVDIKWYSPAQKRFGEYRIDL